MRIGKPGLAGFHILPGFIYYFAQVVSGAMTQYDWQEGGGMTMTEGLQPRNII